MQQKTSHTATVAEHHIKPLARKVYRMFCFLLFIHAAKV
jgi:hypothetical protein